LFSKVFSQFFCRFFRRLKRIHVCRPINALYYRDTALSSRITSFVDYLTFVLGDKGLEKYTAR
jgi:hypothetical protein